MVVAGTGAGSDTDIWPIALNEVLGTKFKLVTGYQGTQEIFLAMERGEAHGRCVISHSALKIAKPDWLRDNKVNVLLVTALARSAEFPNVPAAVDLVGNDDDRRLLELLAGPAAIARPFAGPPGLPPSKAALLRRAFDAMVADPQFIAEATKIGAELAPSTGEEVQRMVERLYGAPAAVIERAKKLSSQ